MTDRTLAEVLEVARSGLGAWWPNPWWPNGRSTYNDCAAFVSWALYGLNGREPHYTYVPHIMDRAIRENRWRGGKALVARPTTRTNADGIQAGDVVIFDWRFRGSRDHVGIALAAPKDGGVRVRQANNGGGGTGRGDVRDPAEDVTYGTQFVLGYYRPPYRTPAPAGGSNAQPIGDDDMTPEQDRMLKALYDLWAPGIAGRHHDGDGWSKIKDIAWRVRNLWDELLLGSEGVKRDGSVAERVKWGWQNSDHLVKALAALDQKVAAPASAESIAKALAPLLTSQVRALSDADLAAAASATANEIDRRTRDRLKS